MSTNLTRITQRKSRNDMAKVIYPELSYLVMGILFEIHTKLGNNYQEKHYQRAIASKLKSTKLKFQREVPVILEFEGEKLGTFKIDFVIDDKLILETKMVWRLTPGDLKQALRYLEATNLRLAILANFKSKRLEYRRVVK